VLAYRSWRSGTRRWLIPVGGFLALVHLVFAPILTVYIQTLMINNGRQALQLASSPTVAAAGGKETILVFAPDYVVSVYLPVIIDYIGGPTPRSWRPLAMAPYDHWLRRKGPRTLELEVAQDGVMLRSVFEELYRDPENRLLPDTIIDRGLLRAEILTVSDRGPTRVAFHFDRDLSDSSLDFLVWQDGELRNAKIPELGEELYLNRTLGPGGF
jgi:hypothetical protein